MGDKKEFGGGINPQSNPNPKPPFLSKNTKNRIFATPEVPDRVVRLSVDSTDRVTRMEGSLWIPRIGQQGWKAYKVTALYG